MRVRPRSVWLVIAAACLCAILWAAPPSGNSQTEAILRLTPDRAENLGRVIAVQERHTQTLMALPGVVGTGVGVAPEGHLAVEVYTSMANVDGIPSVLDSMPVVVEETGVFSAFAFLPPPLGGCYRPVPIGVSTGNVYTCETGTIGCVVIRNGSKCILSNNHILARMNAAQIGEAIAQPGLKDHYPECEEEPANGCTPRVASLVDFEPINFSGGDNTMDAAVAQYWGSNVTCATLSGFYGFPGGQLVTAYIGMPIKKVGKSSRQTSGTVIAVNVTSNIEYPPGGVYAHFVGQIRTSAHFGWPGDSGSLVVTDDPEAENLPVGLLFAGQINNGTALLNPIAPILDRFSATICTGD